MKTEQNSKSKIIKRMTALLVAVVFVFGTMVIPSQIYADEPDDQDTAITETVETEAPGEEAEVAEPEAAEVPEADAEAAGTDAVEAPTESVSAAEPAEDADSFVTEADVSELTDLVIAEDEGGNSIDIEDVDEDTYDGFIYMMKDDTTKSEIKEMEKAIDDLDKDQEAEEIADKELYAADSIETIAEVAPAEQVEYIEPNYIMKAFGEPNDEDYDEHGWYLEMINAPYVWNRNQFGKGATVAVLDSGVKTDLSDFASSTFKNPYNAMTGSSTITDNVGHGTAVSAVIAAAYNNETALTGIMPKAQIIPVKVLDIDSEGEASGTTADVVRGIKYAVNKNADVINMSLGGPSSSTLKSACKDAASEGVIVVAAAGNEADVGNPLEYPASYGCTISVGAVNENGKHSYFSNHNKYVTVSAPGESIYAPWLYENRWVYADLDGTSFATPMVAAMAAMVKSKNKGVGVSGFAKIIERTAKDRGAKGKDKYYGYGLMKLNTTYRYLNGDMSLFEMKFPCTKYTYDGKAKKPSVTVMEIKHKVSTDNYKVTYPAGRTKVGKYTVKVTATGGHYYGSKNLSFQIIPPLVKKLKKLKVGETKMTVRWYAMSQAQKDKYRSAITGYQVRVSRKANFSKSKTVKVKGIGKTKAVVKGLKSNRKYYVQYRSYKVVNGVTYYSKWSKKKSAWTD